MAFIPVELMWERVQVAHQDSDTSLFNHLLYFGEMLCKIVASGLISAIQDDRDRHRYRQLHRVVRADSLGEWAATIKDILTGPAAQFLTPMARVEQRELTQKCKHGTWQYDAVSALSKCLKQIEQNHEGTEGKADARKWFHMFVQLRNGTRGHGITHGVDCARLCPPLEASIKLICENFNLFRRQWAYLHRNLSDKYRVTKLSQIGEEFDSKKFTPSAKLENGVYVFLDGHKRVELIWSDAEASDFSFPNGNFSGKSFELISYVTGNKSKVDGTPYLAPATELPPSQTQGMGLLDIQGNCFGNLPVMPSGYVSRPGLEAELLNRLKDDRHSVVTLHGSGGIGKTSLALAVLHALKAGDRFGAMGWFSARDIDLLSGGPKLVKPHVLTEAEIAKEFVELMAPEQISDSKFQPLKYLSETLTSSPLARISHQVF